MLPSPADPAGAANLSSCARLFSIDARRTDETSRLNLRGLNFRVLNPAILYAVQSGFRYPAIACQLSLVAWPALPTFSS